MVKLDFVKKVLFGGTIVPKEGGRGEKRKGYGRREANP